MKNFMLIFIGEDYADLNFSPEEMQRRMNRWKEWTGKLVESGIFVDGQGLLKNARTLKSGPEDVHDGPFLDIKETVGGYYVVKAEDMDAAVEVAKDFPDFDLGSSVEIRECMPGEEG